MHLQTDTLPVADEHRMLLAPAMMHVDSWRSCVCHSRSYWRASSDGFPANATLAPHALSSRRDARRLLPAMHGSRSQDHPYCGKWHHCHPSCTGTMGRGLFAGGLAWIAFSATTIYNDDGSSGSSRVPSCEQCRPCMDSSFRQVSAVAATCQVSA